MVLLKEDALRLFLCHLHEHEAWCGPKPIPQDMTRPGHCGSGTCSILKEHRNTSPPRQFTSLSWGRSTDHRPPEHWTTTRRRSRSQRAKKRKARGIAASGRDGSRQVRWVLDGVGMCMRQEMTRSRWMVRAVFILVKCIWMYFGLRPTWSSSSNQHDDLQTYAIFGESNPRPDLI